MLAMNGFTHPVNNPSLGPGAVVLSWFGINNPSLIVYKSQIWRLFMSSFLCSGCITYFFVVLCLWSYTRKTEARMMKVARRRVNGLDRDDDDSSWRIYFFAVFFIISLGSNLIYAMTSSGASCGSIALVLGLNSFSIAMNVREFNAGVSAISVEHDDDDQTVVQKTEMFPAPWVPTILIFLYTVCFLPYNSLIMMVSAMVLGIFTAQFVFYFTDAEESDDVTIQGGEIGNFVAMRMSSRSFSLFSILFLTLFLLLTFRVVRPNEKYKVPYLTGCNTMYSTNVDDIVNDYYGNNRERQRWLEDNDGQGTICAQMCVPNVAYIPIYWGVNGFFPFSVSHGTCEDNGYREHVSDKTITKLSYSVDVELYSFTGSDDDYVNDNAN